METYDLVMLGILAAATLFGMYKGFAWQIASLASLVVSYFVAYRFRDVVTPMISASPLWNTFTAMLAVYSGTSLVIWAGFRVVADLLDKMRLKHFDRQMGGLLGFGKGVLFCVVVTFFAATLLGESIRRDIVHSRSGHYIAKLLHDSDRIMPEEIKSVLGPYLEELDDRLDPTGVPRNDSDERDEDRDGDLPLFGSGRSSGGAGGAGSPWPTTRQGDDARSTSEKAARDLGAEVGSRLWQEGVDQFNRSLDKNRPATPRR